MPFAFLLQFSIDQFLTFGPIIKEKQTYDIAANVI